MYEYKLHQSDCFVQYYPDLYPGRRGSLAPWSLRLLLAELPSHAGQQVLQLLGLHQAVLCCTCNCSCRLLL